MKTVQYISRIVFVASLLTFVSSTLFAQKEEVVIIGSYQPSLSDAFKINKNPEMIDTTYPAPKFTYDITSKRVPTTFQIEAIKAAKLVGEPITRLYKNLLKAGFGTYVTPYIEFFANNTRSKKYSYGVHLRHFSSTGKIQDYAKSSFSENELNVYGDRFFQKSTLSGDLFFDRKVVHYYGFQPKFYDSGLIPDDDAIRQRYATIGFNAKYQSNYTDSNKLNHSFTLGFYNLSDDYSASENAVKLGTSLSQDFELLTLTKKQTLGLNADATFYHNKNNSMDGKGSLLVHVQPYLQTQFNEYRLLIGLTAAVEAADETNLHLYPYIEGKVAIIPGILGAYAGLSGNMEKVSYRSLSTENPYIKSDIPLGYTDKNFEIYGGINTSLTDNIDLGASIHASHFKTMPFFVTDTTGGNLLKNKFTAVYDEANLLTIKGDMMWKARKDLSFLIAFSYNKYSVETETEVWHKPTVEGSLQARYSLRDKFVIQCNAFAFGKMYARDFEANGTMKVIELDPKLDLSLAFEYRYTKMLSFFLNFNNLTTTRYENWYRYPSQKFNFMGGITYAF